MDTSQASSMQSEQRNPVRSVRVRWRHLAVVALTLGVSVITGVHHPVAADAGADLALSAASGPVGSTLELSSPDVFSMGADVCPGVDGTRSWDDGDTFEVRWELGLMLDGSVGTRVIEGADFFYTTLGTEVVRVLGAGAVSTEPGVPWRTTVTVPEGVSPGQRLVVNASCWRLGPALDGGEQEWMTFYYLPVFTVTDVDGSVPTTAPPTTAPAPTPGAPSSSAPPASALPGSASFTG